MFPRRGAASAEVERRIAALCGKDYSYRGGTVFNSISSEPLPCAARIFKRHLAANMGDNRIFPSLPQAERRVTAMLGELLGAGNAHGMVVSGGTEANLLAMAAAVRQFRSSRQNARRPQVLAPESVHFSVEKAAVMLDVELVRAPLDSQYRVDVDGLRRRICGRTALVIVTAGTSECGAIDDVASVAEFTRRAGIPLHVDAATGGFLIPFARELGYEMPEFDFSVPGVTSITIDPHKYGFAPVPAGCLLARDSGVMAGLNFESHYVGTRNHASLLGTRPGAGVLATYAALMCMGRDGYREAVGRLFRSRDLFLDEALRQGLRLAYRPQLTIVGIRVDSPRSALSYLEARGLIASVSKRHDFLRIVVQRHLRGKDYRELLKHLKALSPVGATA